MTIERILPSARYSEAVVHGDTVYLAGQVGEGQTVAEQTRSALACVEKLLTEAGSEKSKVLAATIWLADMADYAEMNSVWDEWIGGQNPPTRATGEVKLASPDFKIEIIIVAARN